MFEIKSDLLLSIFNLIYTKDQFNEIKQLTTLEILVESNVLTISINFNDNYYITYTKKEYEHDPVEMVLSSLVLEKLYNISVMFSGTTVTIDTDPDDHVLIKVIPDSNHAKRMKIS